MYANWRTDCRYKRAWHLLPVADRWGGWCCRIEEWRDAVGYEGHYQVSNLGRVRSVDHTTVHKDGRVSRYKGKMLAISLNGDGYRKTIFSVNGVHTHPRICRLVAMAFIPNPNNYDQVNHKDENKLNDCVGNLEWCDAKYNMNYGTAPRRRGEKKRKPVEQFTLNGEFIRRWPCASIAEKETGVDHSHIARCCKSKLRQTKGFIWKYAESEENNL